MLMENTLKTSWSEAKSRARDYKDDESGSLIIFSLFIFFTMIIFGGIAVDMMLYENERTNIQNSTDRAVLAAANLNQTVDPKLVVIDYLAKVGVTVHPDDVDVQEVGTAPVITGRQVAVNVSSNYDTILMGLVGVDDLPFKIAPCLCNAKRTAHCNRHRLSRKSKKQCILRQALPNGLCHLLNRGGLVQSLDRGDDARKRLIRLKKEVAGNQHVGDLPIYVFKISNHQLATGNLVLSMHFQHLILYCAKARKPRRAHRFRVYLPKLTCNHKRRRHRHHRLHSCRNAL